MKPDSAFLVRKFDDANQVAFWGRNALLGVSGALLVFAPLAYGAVHNWAYFSVGLVVALMSLGLAGIASFQLWTRSRSIDRLPYPPLWWLALGLILLLVLQLVSWPQDMVRWLSPAAIEIRALGTGEALSPYLPLSLNPHATLLEGLKLWPALVMFFLLVYLISTRQQLLGLVWLILGVALFEVLYGFWNFHSKTIWGWKNIYTGSRLCGTFINSNHLGGLLTMTILLGFGLFLAQRREIPFLKGLSPGEKSLRVLSRAESLEPKARSNILLVPLFLLAVGLVFTGSRGSMISLVMGFTFMALLIYGQRWRKSHIPTMLIFLTIAVAYSIFLGSGPFLARFLDLNHEGRYHACKGALAIFQDFPWVGSGVATFGDLFFRFEPANLAGYRFVYTHNDWLQLLAETGLAGFVLVLAAWIVFFGGLVKQWQSCQNQFARGLGLGGLAAIAAGSFHALMEFLFHIPAYSLFFAVVAAITYLAIHSHWQGVECFSYPKLSNRTVRLYWGLVPALVIIQLLFVFQVSRLWRAELAAPTETNSIRLPTRISQEDYRRALVFDPRNSLYYEGLARSLMGKNMVADKGFPEALHALRQAVRWAPADWRYRSTLAEFYLASFRRAPTRYVPMAFSEMTAALALFPNSAFLHLRVALILTWAEKYYVGLIPKNFINRRRHHAERAVVLKPKLEKVLMSFQ